MTLMNWIADHEESKFAGVGAGALMVVPFGSAFVVALAYVAHIIL